MQNETNVKRTMKDRSIDAQKRFIEKAQILFPEYDYSKVDFLNKKDGKKVCIICPKHGEFWVIPHNLLKNNCSCNYCKGRVTNIGEFLYKANKVHNNKYDYSKVNFVNQASKIEIICPKHGSFFKELVIIYVVQVVLIVESLMEKKLLKKFQITQAQNIKDSIKYLNY